MVYADEDFIKINIFLEGKRPSAPVFLFMPDRQARSWISIHSDG